MTKLIESEQYAEMFSKKTNSNSPIYKVEIKDLSNTYIKICLSKIEALAYIKQELHKNHDATIKLFKEDKLIDTYGKARIVKGKKR